MLQLQQITFGYAPGKKVLDACSLELEPNRIYALMGANGSGKTTLFNLVTGFLRTQVGNITFKGQCINRLKPYEINRLGIGRTFQDLRVITRLTIQENVILAMQDNPTDRLSRALLPLWFHQSGLAQLSTIAGEMISQFFLDSVTHSPAGEVSYGQQKLLTLACCVANGAETILLDEPVAGINPDYRTKMVGLLKQLKQQGKTILLIEHNADFIDEVADRIYFLSAGSLSSYETVAEMRADPRVLEAFLI